MNSCLYQCKVMHKRVTPIMHGFAHSYFLFYLDLDEIDHIHRSCPVIGRGPGHLYEFRDDDHVPYRGGSLRERIANFVRDNGVKEEVGRVMLLTGLRTGGYVFNPASFYFFFDKNGKELAAVLQITNTFQEQKLFFLSQEHFTDGAFRRKEQQSFYISPFMPSDSDLDMILVVPDEALSLTVDVVRDGKKPFFASLTGKRRALNTSNLLWLTFCFPWVTWQVIIFIHIHALILWLKKVPFFWKDENAHLQRGFFCERHKGGFKS